MHWKVYKDESPGDGQSCIVARFVNRDGTPSTCILTYVRMGFGESYWQTKSGDRILCNDTDNWCYVDDVIDAVADRIKENFPWEIEKAKMRYSYLF